MVHECCARCARGISYYDTLHRVDDNSEVLSLFFTDMIDTGFVLVGSVGIPWLFQDFFKDKKIISRATKQRKDPVKGKYF